MKEQPRFMIIAANREQKPDVVLPVGACIISSALKSEGISVRFLDLSFAADNQVQPLIVQALKSFKPHIVGISLRNIDNADFGIPKFYLPEYVEIVNTIRKYSDIPVLMGGAGYSLYPLRILKYLGADFGYCGTSVEPLVNLVRESVAGTPVSPPGMYTVDGYYPDDSTDNRLLNTSPEFWEWLDLRQYKKQNAFITVRTKIGCPFKCVYCNYSRIEGSKCYILRDPADVVSEIDQNVRKTGIKRIEFVDSTFNFPAEHTREILKRIINLPYQLCLQASGITPAGDPSLVSLMKKAGFVAFFVSPDAGARDTLKSYSKGFTVEALKETATVIGKSRVPTLWSFMMGGPGETHDTVAETFRFARKYISRKNVVFFVPRIRIYPGTRLEEIAISQGYPEATLEPCDNSWFLEKGLDGEWMDRTIAWEVYRNHNYMFIYDSQTRFIPFIQKMMAFLKDPSASWRYIPYIYKSADIFSRGRYRKPLYPPINPIIDGKVP